METRELELEVDGKPSMVVIPLDQYEACVDHAHAISLANKAIARQVELASVRIRDLTAELQWRYPVAYGFKLVSLICATVLGIGIVPEGGARWVGFAIVILSVFDFVFANQKSLGYALDARSGQRSIIDFAKGSETRMIRALRTVRTRPEETLDAYASYLVKVLEDMEAGGVELRKRMERRESELAERLRVPEPAVAGEAESGAVKKK